MTINNSVTATFVVAPKAMIGATGYTSLNSANKAAAINAVILLLDTELVENMTMNLNKSISIAGGYNATYGCRTGLPTELSGVLTISTGSLTVDSLAVK
jgi:hypothetical protein